MRAELIVWRDAYNSTDGEWKKADDIKGMEPVLVSSVFFLVHENQDGLVVASDYDPEGEEYHGTAFIPLGMVKSRHKLKLPSKNKKAAS